jgi:hypothetical protein
MSVCVRMRMREIERRRMRERKKKERNTFSMSESKVTNFYLRLGGSTFLLSRLPSIIFLL